MNKIIGHQTLCLSRNAARVSSEAEMSGDEHSETEKKWVFPLKRRRVALESKAELT